MLGRGPAPRGQAGRHAPLLPPLLVQRGITPAHGHQRGRAPARLRHLRRRAIHAKPFGQRAGRMQGRIALAAVADGHVHARVLQQVHGIRAGIQAQLILRTGLMEAPQPRHQPQRRERMRRGHRQRSRCRRRPQSIQGLRDVQESAMHSREQARALVGQAHAARHAIEERESHAPLQRLDLMRDRRRRDRKLGRGQLEAAQPGRRLERAQRRDRKRGEHGETPYMN
ncbi:hypothetical protein D3C85_1108380 [compost metagenome]